MARVDPFPALSFDGLDASPAGGLERAARLFEAPDPWAALDRWAREGRLVSLEPALYLVETRPFDAGRRPPVRFLLGAMQADVAELERGTSRSAQPPIGPVPVLAADDHHVLADLLAEAAEAKPPLWEAAFGAQRIRLWQLGPGALTRRIRAAVDAAHARPHGIVPERGPFLAAVVPLSDPGLRLLPFHRGIAGVETFSPGTFLALVSDYARVYELDAPLDTHEGLEAARARLAEMAARHHAFLLVLPGGEGRLLRFRQALELSHIPAAPKSPTLRSLDLALLNALVLRTVLGVREPESPQHPNVFAVASLADLVRQVDDGIFQAGFALNPPPAWEVRAVMEAAQALPPRTLRLSPVPPAGLLFLDPRARG